MAAPGEWIVVEPSYFANREVDIRANPWVNGEHAFRAMAFGLVFMLWVSALTV